MVHLHPQYATAVAYVSRLPENKLPGYSLGSVPKAHKTDRTRAGAYLRKRLFALAWLANGRNGVQAARQAGYTGTPASLKVNWYGRYGAVPVPPRTGVLVPVLDSKLVPRTAPGLVREHALAGVRSVHRPSAGDERTMGSKVVRHAVVWL